MTNTTPQPTRFSTIQRLLAIAVAIVIVLIASVLSNKISAPQADAALSPSFCIGAKYEKFVGKHGPKECTDPQPAPPPFILEGSRDGATYNLKSEAKNGSVRLTFPATNMTQAPGNTVYALYSVRTTSASAAGRVVIESTTPTSADASRLTYGVKIAMGSACSASTYAMAPTVIANNSPLTTNSPTAFEIPANGAKAISVCVAITRPASDAQGAISVPVSFDIRSAN